MATHRVRLFELPLGYEHNPTNPTRPVAKAVEQAPFTVDVDGTHDAARAAVAERLAAYGYLRVRSISALAEGGFAAVVYAKEKADVR